MLTKPQRDHITSSFIQFAEELPPAKIKELYFRLDDLIQYGNSAVYIAYAAVSQLLKKEE